MGAHSESRYGKVGSMSFIVIWGAGEEETGRETFDSIRAVIGMLQADSELTGVEIDKLIYTGKLVDEENFMQFDQPWMLLYREVFFSKFLCRVGLHNWFRSLCVRCGVRKRSA